MACRERLFRPSACNRRDKGQKPCQRNHDQTTGALQTGIQFEITQIRQ